MKDFGILHKILRAFASWQILAAIILAGGAFLRIDAIEPLSALGFDENVYRFYVTQVEKYGPLHYSELARTYLQMQQGYSEAILPPTRVTFILATGLWHHLFGGTELESVRAVSCVASIFLLPVSFAFAWRLKNRAFALGVLILMAVAPLEIHLAHRALIDGFFSLIALIVLWSFWETLQNSSRWIWIYGVALTLLILTKENAAFVYMALLGLLVLNRWLGFGTVTRLLLVITALAPLVGIGLLIFLMGNPATLWAVYSLNISRSLVTPYAIAMGDGPWFRYLTDLLLISPAILVFAIGGAFLLTRREKTGWYLFAFVMLSYAVMTCVRYGMNLRHAAIWDFPLRFLALIPIFLQSDRLKHLVSSRIFVIIAIALLALAELVNYYRIFVEHSVYDPVPSEMLRALNILKP